MSQLEQPAVGLDAEVDEALRAGLRDRSSRPATRRRDRPLRAFGSTSWLGRYADVRVGETAYGHRDAQFIVHVGGTAEEGSDDVDRDWARGAWSAVLPP